MMIWIIQLTAPGVRGERGETAPSRVPAGGSQDREFATTPNRLMADWIVRVVLEILNIATPMFARLYRRVLTNRYWVSR